MTINDILHNLANQVNPSSKGKELAGPYHLMFHDERWTLATDHRSMLWVKEWKQTAEEVAARLILSVQFDSPVHKRLVQFFIPPEECERHETSLADLKAFLGEPEWNSECPACKGISAKSPHVFCTFCDSDGVVGAEVRPGMLYGLPIDRSRLARIVEPMADYDVPICIGKQPKQESGEQYQCVWVIHPNFRAILVQMTPSYDVGCTNKVWDEAPRYPR